MAELTAIITVADVDARLSVQARTRLFAKNGGSTVDTAFQALMVAQANSRIRTITRAAFPDGLYQVGDTLDPEVVGHGCAIVFAMAASAHLTSDDTSGYRVNAKAAETFFRSLNRDRDDRLPGSSNPLPQPQASIANTTDDAGNPTNPYVRGASGQDLTGF